MPPWRLRASSTWFSNFQWLDENTNLPWMDPMLNIYFQFSKLENRSRIVEPWCSFFPEFSGWPAFSALEQRTFSVNLSELNWTWIASLFSTCFKHKLSSLDNEKLGIGVKCSMLWGRWTSEFAPLNNRYNIVKPQPKRLKWWNDEMIILILLYQTSQYPQCTNQICPYQAQCRHVMWGACV